MTVSDRKKRLTAARDISDVEAGDLVRRYGHRRVGIVEEVNEGHALIAWGNGFKDILPLAGIRKVRPGGSEYDVRKP